MTMEKFFHWVTMIMQWPSAAHCSKVCSSVEHVTRGKGDEPALHIEYHQQEMSHLAINKPEFYYKSEHRHDSLPFNIKHIIISGCKKTHNKTSHLPPSEDNSSNPFP